MTENYKTLCCDADYYKKGRAHYCCETCGDDVTLDLMLMQTYDRKDESKL